MMDVASLALKPSVRKMWHSGSWFDREWEWGIIYLLASMAGIRMEGKEHSPDRAFHFVLVQ
jgi:hypothetical protein